MQPDTRLDQYEIVDQLGEGGMGAVYRARDARLQRDIAIKDCTRRRLATRSLFLAALAWSTTAAALAQQDLTPASGPRPETLRVVILGTGTPNADPERSGPGVAVIAGGEAYLVDAGPGVVRRAAAADELHDLPGLAPDRLRHVFLTHLHSDHTVGLPDVMLGNFVLDRPFPLDLHGPPGTARMAEYIEKAWARDLEIRTGGLEPHSEPNYRAVVREHAAADGRQVVYEDDRVSVEAIPVPHAEWDDAFGYRFTDGERVIVVSGDTTPTDALVEACDGCDVLVHEVYSAEAWERREPVWQAYHASAHTSTRELADIARRARPRLLVLYHQLYWGATDAGLLREIREAGYDGQVVSARDLDVF